MRWLPPKGIHRSVAFEHLELPARVNHKIYPRGGAPPAVALLLRLTKLADGSVLEGGGETMAVYEFECQACGERFEVTMGISEHDRIKDQPPACPKCGKREARQLVSSFNCKAPSKY